MRPAGVGAWKNRVKEEISHIEESYIYQAGATVQH